MPAPRRVGTERSATRSVLLDVTEQLMVEESFAAVTSRRVAGRAGVNAALVHYYFPTIDDLFVAVYRRHAKGNTARLNEVVQDDQPLWAMWEFNTERTATALVSEFLALANHRKAIYAEITHTAKLYREAQVEALSRVLDRYRIEGAEVNAAAIVVVMVSIPRTLVIEETLGVTTGHKEARALVEHYLTQLEGPRKRPSPAPAQNSAGPAPEGQDAP